jgi:hypothetical protein
MTVNMLSCFGVGLLQAERRGERQVREQFSVMGITAAFVGNLYGSKEEEGGTESIIHKFPTL